MEALAAGEVAPPDYYFRGATFFDTSASRCAWLTKHVVVCTGPREPAEVILQFYMVV